MLNTLQDSRKRIAGKTAFNRISAEDTNPELESIALQISEFLSSRDVLHALIGGLAAGKYSRPRFTQDIDFIIPESAESEVRELGESQFLDGPAPGISVYVNGTDVDFIFAPEDMPDDAYSSGSKMNGVPVLDVRAFVLMKILSGRDKDIKDVIEILKQDKTDEKEIKSYIEEFASQELDEIESLLSLAELERSLEQTSSLNPNSLVKSIRTIASYLERSKNPSRTIIQSHLNKIRNSILTFQ